MSKLLDSYTYISELIGKKTFVWKVAFVMNSFQNLLANVFIGFSIQMIIDGLHSNNENLIDKGIVLLFIGATYLMIGLPILCYLLDSTNAKMKMALEVKVFDKVLKKDYEDAILLSSSEIISVLQNDVLEVAGLFGWNLVVFFQAVLSGIGCFVLLVKVDYILALLIVVFSAALLFLNKVFGKSLYSAANNIRELFHKRMESLTNILDNLMILKIYSMMNLQCYFLSKIGREKANIEYSMRKKINFKALVESIITDVFITIVIIILGSSFVYRGEMSIGELFLTIELKNGIIFFFSYIGGYINNLQSAIVATEHIRNLNAPLEIQQEKMQTSVIEDPQYIEFENVSYKYPGANKTVFSSLNFKTTKKKICIIGENGKGKSTIIKLFSGYLKSYTGRILINNTNIFNLDIKNLVSIVPQETIIMKDTIYNNIVLGGQYTIEEVIEATRKAGIYDEIMEMEKGFETVLYEDGTNISAGQRKRIAIARAFLKDAPIMLLDEFSGNLDKEMANKILESLFDNLNQ